ncbi:hypothetical protein DD238_005463 [Peronospora effusa]|uniref:AB hydrolase-1 domain-containing protein n=1 Tax=Peronospora effusa TaxID=542832 RepID=A0A3M6VTW6_9STRA|nr:hypothetical protein DD238_005463 [Peronospora effusa]
MAFVRVCIIAAFTSWSGYYTQASSTKTTGLPSLKFQFTLKRSSVQVQGLTELSVFANPIELDGGDSVLYDVFSSFTERDTVHNYYLVNGIGMSSSVSNFCTENVTMQCQDSLLDDIPSINTIISALNEATAVSSEAGTFQSAMECPNGNLFKVTINNIDFALCTVDSLGFTMHGSDMDVKVEYLNAHLNIRIPTSISELNCDTVATRSSITQIGKYLLTGKLIQGNARSLKAAIDFSSTVSPTTSSACSCKSTRRPCIFFHGWGRDVEMPENQNNYTEYWGEHLFEHTPCCSSIKFARLNTINDPWTSRRQQRKVCDRLLAVSDKSTDVKIVNTIVVTHSLSGLMLAGALSSGLCTLDSSSSWVALAPPMMGSGAADFAQESCDGNLGVVATEFGELTGKCPPDPALKAMSYQGGKYSSKSLDAAYVAAQKAFQANVYAVICSKRSSGLLSVRQVMYWALGKILPHHSKQNDGMVDFESCAGGVPLSKFGETWKSRFYLTELNHSDVKLVFRDSRWNESKMPRKWFECLL